MNSSRTRNNYSSSRGHSPIHSSARLLAIKLLSQAYDSPKSVAQMESSVADYFRGREDENFLEIPSSRDLYIQQIVRIGLHLSQSTYSGYYSLLFNKLARSNLDPDFLQTLPQWSLPEFFPELYQNPNLTSEERSTLEKRHLREYLALLNAFHEAERNPAYPQFFRQCDEDELEDADAADLYSQCYNQICVQETFEVTGSLEEAGKPTYSSPIITQFITDVPSEGILLRTYCLPTRDLLISMVQDQRNPLTGLKYSRSTRKEISQKFTTELKLVEYAVSRAEIPYSLEEVSLEGIYLHMEKITP